MHSWSFTDGVCGELLGVSCNMEAGTYRCPEHIADTQERDRVRELLMVHQQQQLGLQQQQQPSSSELQGPHNVGPTLQPVANGAEQQLQQQPSEQQQQPPPLSEQPQPLPVCASCGCCHAASAPWPNTAWHGCRCHSCSCHSCRCLSLLWLLLL